jgi:hypothetical protein
MKAERRYAGIDPGKRTYAMVVIGLDGKVRSSNGRTGRFGGGKKAGSKTRRVPRRQVCKVPEGHTAIGLTVFRPLF